MTSQQKIVFGCLAMILAMHLVEKDEVVRYLRCAATLGSQ